MEFLILRKETIYFKTIIFLMSEKLAPRALIK